MKKAIAIILLLALCLSMPACTAGKSEARKVLDSYLQYLSKGLYEDAYDCLSDFDKTNITQDEFTAWREVIDEIQKTKEYSIGTKADTFKNYEYKGAQYKKAYGFLITQKVEKFKNIEITGYDAEEYHIMVGLQDNTWKIALLIIDLPSVTDQYKRKMDDSKASGQ